jgi:AraC family transcriptional regulator of adaptative response/methylated-DNA-[protein]-cysteine methyltransferase
VQFFPSPAEARAAGYRPCRRCAPDLPLAPRAELVARACRLIETTAEPLSLDQLGRELAVSPYHLQRVFKAATGLTPRQYAAGLRAGRIKNELRSGRDVTTALYEAGYNSAGRFYADAPLRLGMNPRAYRQGGIEMHIHYSISACFLGRLLVAATARGVCAVSLGDTDAELEAMLRREYPAAELERVGEPGVETAAVLSYLSGQNPRLELPLDVQATAFQLRVWEELRRIPYGETRTYTQVAAAVGKPAAVRAVANACAANPAALVTPCHRVIRGDGTLGGYRWGLERKRKLLEREKPI